MSISASSSIDPVAIDQQPAPAFEPLRLGCVSYLNTTPLIEGLDKLRSLSLTLAPPARLVDLLLNNQIDAGLLSIIDYQTAPGAGSAPPLTLLPVGMIGCDGPTLTVRLLSSVPLERLSRVHADVESHTSVALLRIILAERCGVRPAFVPFDAAAHGVATGVAADARWPEAFLIIGDKVVTAAPPDSLYPHQLDLGQAWLELTGLPFVYACWMCRTEHADEPRFATLARVLDRQRRHNATRLGWIADRRAPQCGWPSGAAHHYLRDLLRFEFTPRHREGVDRFFDLCQTHAIIPVRRGVAWR